jgi:hypothetical protein
MAVKCAATIRSIGNEQKGRPRSLRMITTLHTSQHTDTQPQLDWPLPGTKAPNGHLTWAQWIAYQAGNLSAMQSNDSTEARPTLSARPDALRLVAGNTMQDALAHRAWPLPATKVPNGRLSWAQWLVAQAQGLAGQQRKPAATERAA